MGSPYSWAPLVAQMVKNLPAMWETWVQSLGWQDPLEKGKSTPLQYSGLENSVHGVSKSQTQLSDFLFITVHGTALPRQKHTNTPLDPGQSYVSHSLKKRVCRRHLR